MGKRLFYITIIFSGVSGCYGQLSPSLYAFDNPYPTSSYQQVLQTCAQAWDLLQTLQGLQTNHEDDTLIVDALLGCMLRFQNAVCHVIDDCKQKTRMMPIEDFVYVQALIDQCIQMQDAVKVQGDADQLMKQLLLQTQQACVQAINFNSL